MRMVTEMITARRRRRNRSTVLMSMESPWSSSFGRSMVLMRNFPQSGLHIAVTEWPKTPPGDRNGGYLEKAFWDGDHVPGHYNRRPAPVELRHTAMLNLPLDGRAPLPSPIGIATRHGHGVRHCNPTHVGVAPRTIHLAQDIEGAIVHDLDRDLGINQVAVLQRSDDILLHFTDRFSSSGQVTQQRQRDGATAVHGKLTRQGLLAEDVNSNLVPRP